MTLEATAEALANGEAMPEAPAETMTEDQILDAAFDKMQPEEEADDQTPDKPETGEDEAAAEEAAEGDDEAAEGEEGEADGPEPVEAPTELPRAVRDAWKDIPETARDAIVEAQRDANRKLSEQGRLIQGISPIRDVLVDAAQKLPALANMKPAEVAQEVMQLAQLSHQFNAQPVETITGLIKKHGLERAVFQALQGQGVPQGTRENVTLKNEIASLKRQLAQVSDPEYLREQVTAFTTESQTQAEVNAFAQQAEHWGAVENHMPVAIQMAKAKLGQDASPKDVLKAAYDLAVSQFVPDGQKAKSEPAARKAAQDNPEKTESARNAKSVNVTSRPSNKPKKLTADEAMEEAWRRMQSK